jgi:hypothetical protein
MREIHLCEATIGAVRKRTNCCQHLSSMFELQIEKLRHHVRSTNNKRRDTAVRVALHST